MTKTVADREAFRDYHVYHPSHPRRNYWLGDEVEKDILFDIRAHGDAREDSDNDILVVINVDIVRRVKRLLSTRVPSR